MAPRFNINESEKARILGLHGLNGVNLIKEQQTGYTLKGTVTDNDDGQSLPGVNIVIIERTGVGTSTNLDGKFTLSGITEGESVKITFIGYQTVTIPFKEIKSGGNKEIKLKSGVSVDEVEVTAERTKVSGCMDKTAINYKKTAWIDCAGTEFGKDNPLQSDEVSRDGQLETSTKKYDKTCCEYSGCTDSKAKNYNPQATIDDNSCVYVGCMDSGATNYNPKATIKGKCSYISGCMDKTAKNYNSKAVKDGEECVYTSGCMDKTAKNYNPKAVKDGKDCKYVKGCTDKAAKNYKAKAVKDDGSCKYETIIPPDLMSEFVNIGEWEVKGDLLSSLDNLVDGITRYRFLLHIIESWYKSDEKICTERSVKLSDIKGKLISGGLDNSLDDLYGLLKRLNKKKGLPRKIEKIILKLLNKTNSIYNKVDRKWDKIEKVKKTGEGNVNRYLLSGIRRSMTKSYRDGEKALNIVNSIKCS